MSGPVPPPPPPISVAAEAAEAVAAPPPAIPSPTKNGGLPAMNGSALPRAVDEPLFVFEAPTPQSSSCSWWIRLWRTIIGDCMTPKYTATVVVRTLWRRRVEVALRTGFAMLLACGVSFYPPIRVNYVSVPYMVPTIASIVIQRSFGATMYTSILTLWGGFLGR